MSVQAEPSHVPWIFWPFVMLWRLLTGLLKLVGRFILIALGLAIGVAGVLLSATIVGAIIGVPLAILGLMLMIRGIF